MTEIGAVDYNTSIPNNVDLASDRRVLRALERWHPGYLDWWKDMGPEGFQEALVYLRTAVNVDRDGLGDLRLRENAGLPLGHSAGAAGGGPHHPLRRACGASRSGRRFRANTAHCCAA